MAPVKYTGWAFRATNVLVSAKTLWYVAMDGAAGTCYEGKGMGANVTVTEVDHIKALEAVMDGFE